MRTVARIVFAAWAASAVARAGDEWLDRVEQATTWADAAGQYRARLSGTLDLEEYALPDPAPGLIDADGSTLFNPRLALFLDAQAGDRTYLFAQARVDRGFDPAREHLRARLDELALRVALDADRRLNVQLGKFATVVGSWTARHDSWTNPFITAPLPYEHLTGVWDSEPPHSAAQLLLWSHARPGLPDAVTDQEKYVRLPIIWGPSYATGVAVAGELEQWRYAFELKNASLSSRPEVWPAAETKWDHPTFSGRIRYVPDERWEFGWSASAGTFLRPEGFPAIVPPHRPSDYQEIVLGQDIGYAWHHLQVWAEIYAARFKAPPAGNADTAAYYVEAKYRFGPRFSGAVRWNQQWFGTVEDRGASVQWQRNVWRVDVAPEVRFTPHVQLKLQCSLQRGEARNNALTQFAAAQLTVRF
jgi:hypothetical protein